MFFAVSGLRNTAYSQFDIEQIEQINTTRRAILTTNEIFDYDQSGKTEDVNSKKM